ncbi:MAG: outer membrane beta-barrel protein [Proteobacteria bacterium]|nr:outer membrane beta-barrel protein [Pseudomonadota bacterium]
MGLRWKSSCIGVVFCLLFCLVSSYASAEIKVGNLKIIPELSVSQIYDTNIYQNTTVAANGTPVDVRKDFITITTPGLRLIYDFGGKHTFTLGGNVGINNYWHYTRNDFGDYNGNAALNLKFTNIDFDFGQTYQNSYMKRSNDDPTNRMRPFESWNSNISMAYKFADRWKIKPFYTRLDQAFRSDLDRSQSYIKETSGISLFYRFTPRTSALVEYNYVGKDFKNSDNSDHRDNIIYAGLSFYDPEGKINGDIKGGYAWAKYNHDVVNRENKPKTWVMVGDLMYAFSAYTNVALNLGRYHDDDVDSGNASYDVTSAGLTLQHLFTQKIGGTGKVSYRQSDYLDAMKDNIENQMKKRTDKTWDFGVGAFYKIQKWLEARLDYQYTTKDSNFQAYQYNENKVMFKVSVTTP